MTAKDKNKEFDIAYQNKDIVMKTFADKFKGKSLELFCPNLPRIKDSLETNLPIMIAKESRMDNLFLLEDNSYLNKIA